MSWNPRVSAHNADGISTWDSYSGATGASGTVTAQNALEDLGAGLIGLATGGSATYIQSASLCSAASVDASTFSIPFTSDTAAGNCLILVMGCVTFFGGQFKSFLGDIAVTDSQGNQWQPLSLGDNEAYWRMAWICCPCGAGPNTVTVTTTQTGISAFINFAAAIHEYSGVLPLNPPPNLWAANTSFLLGYKIFLPLLGVVQVATSIGSAPHQTSATMPAPILWSMVPGGTTVDGDITWTCDGYFPQLGGTLGASEVELDGATDLHSTGAVTLTVTTLTNYLLFLFSYIQPYEPVTASGGGTPSPPYGPPPPSAIPPPSPPVTGAPPTYGKTQRGNIDYDQIRAIARTGDGQALVTAGSGNRTPGDLLVWDSSGNAADGGPPPASTAPSLSVQLATTSASDTVALTYANGSSLFPGIGASFTGTANTPIVIDGQTLTGGQLLLVKDDTQSPSGAFNGVYFLSQVQTATLPPILVRLANFNQPSNVNNVGPIAVIAGTANAGTSWLLTSPVTIVGTSPISFTKFTSAGALSNPMTTKGDVIVAGTSGVPARLGVGSNGKVVTANSSATDGVDWEAPIALTTTGSSGAASLTPGSPYTLNVPQYSAAGGISSQSVVTGSRAFNTAYQNTGSTARFVLACIYNTSVTGGEKVQWLSDSSSTPATVLAEITLPASNWSMPFPLFVLPGNYYKMVADGGSPTIGVLAWTEWN